MDCPLDAFGQQPGLNRLYTQLCLAFPPASAERGNVVELLDASLDRLTRSIPWLAGQVFFESDSGRYFIRPAGARLGLVVKDMEKDLPSMDEFRARGYPGKLLDEKLVAPCETIRTRPDEPAPVFLVQANFVEGGLLLVVCGLHSCMDMAALGHIISLFAKTCRGEDLSAEDIGAANVRGADALPLLSAAEMNHAVERMEKGTQKKPAPQSSSEATPSIWSYILFSPAALAKMKASAMESVVSGFVSTDDCLSAFLWQSVTRARVERFASRESETSFTRTVDARVAAGVPLTYTGNAAVKVACRMSAQALVDSSLGNVASQLRMGLKDASYKFRLDATLFSQGRTPEKVSVEPSTGVNLSSWAKEGTHLLEFGPLLGKPEAVRRPTFPAWESLVYLMPKRDDGEIAAAVCLREEDMRGLEADEKFAEYARIVG